MFALVAVEKTAYGFDQLFAYRVPEGLAVGVGCSVLVPFGRGKAMPRVGVVFALRDALPADVTAAKDILERLDAEALLSEDTLATAHYLHEYCFCTWYEAVRCQLPVGLTHRVRRAYLALPEAEDFSLSAEARAILTLLRKRRVYVREDSICKALGLSPDHSAFSELRRAGLIVESADAARQVGNAAERTARLVPLDDQTGAQKLSVKQRDVLALLEEFGALSVRDLCAHTGTTPAVVRTLESRGLVELYDAAVYRMPGDTPAQSAEAITLTTEQKKVARALWAQFQSGGGNALLWGITGSGKTQVYLALADAVLKEGRGVMLLVPEIALTPWLLTLVQARYGARAALFHSALSAGERADAWRRVRAGEADVVVGTRSAIFAPLAKIGLIVLDEEQDDSYKSGQSPRYDAREIAKVRAKRHGALCLLGSATPAVESYAAALAGKMTLHTLPHRYGNAQLPTVEIVDMQSEGYDTRLSGKLLDALGACLARGEQAVLLLNRRGYNTFATCRSCRTVLTCPQCSISLTYHAAENRLLCHYCGWGRAFSAVCTHCGNAGVQFSGFGTQRVEEQLATLLPQARVLRMDSDATAHKGSHAQILEAFRQREADILLGTQMVAKGLDFPDVTLVGVLSVDATLHDDDYRSLERSFSLLTQVVGRAGRGEKPGRAIFQTLTPEEPTLQLAAAQDYAAFFRTEIALRRGLVYPPYCALYVVGFASAHQTAAHAAAKYALDFLRAHESAGKMIVLGPMTARIEKAGGKFRYRLIVKTQPTPGIRALLSALLVALSQSREFTPVSVAIGRNPSEIL
ncbi:MAG: primosomal protein N' [Oscillospiraceae bacterium]|nr:primosomal protein N' [Oscillospiraceae bacterium]